MKRFLVCLLLISPVFVFAQTNFQKGYVVTNSKDTLKGFIDYKERRKNPVSVNFKPVIDGHTQTFTVKNCAGYGVDAEESFSRFAVDISMDKIDIQQLSIGPDSSSRRDTVFLKVLQAGKNVTLFSFTDGFKVRYYYIDKENQEPVEFIRKLYIRETEGSKKVVVEDKSKYTSQISLLIKKFNVDTIIDEEQLSQLKYDKAVFLNIFSEINQQQLVKSKRKFSRFFAGTGLSRARTNYKGIHDFAGPLAKVKVSYLPMLTTGMDFFFNPAIGKLIFRMELSLQMSKSESSLLSEGNYKSHSFDQYTAIVTPQFIYNVYRTDRLKCFMGFGLGIDFSGYRNNTFVTVNSYSGESIQIKNLQEMDAFNYSFQGMVGVVFNKKIEIAAGYSPPTPVSNYLLYSINVQRFRLGVNYLFGKL